MTKYITLLFIILISSIGYSQVINVDSQNPISIPCPYDATQTILTYDNWEIFQTLDDTYSGERDNSVCPTLTNLIGSGFGIDLNSINIEKSVFVRLLDKTQANNFLEPDNLYTLFYGFNYVDEIYFDNLCGTPLCNGLYLELELSDPMYTDTTYKASIIPFTNFDKFSNIECFSSEKTESQNFTEVVYKFSFTDDIPLDESPTPLSPYFETSFDYTVLPEEIQISESLYNGLAYNINLLQLANYNQALVKHYAPGLPSSTNISNTILSPEVPKSQATDINLTIDEYENIEYQLYSQLAGDFIDGSTVDRHPVNIISNSMDWCLFSVELISDNSDVYFKEGGINFADKTGCLQFRNNGKLLVGNENYLHLGDTGKGNVNLRSGGKIILEENSTLVFDGTLILQEYTEYVGDDPLTLIVNKGSNLSFTEDAIVKQSIYGEQLKLNIYNRGGTVDLSNLSSEEINLINIHEEKIEESRSSFSVFPNPANTYTIIEADIQEETLLTIHSSYGQKCKEYTVDESSKILDLRSLTPGAYIMHLKTNNKRLSKKLVIN
jgi:hypothetical protein